MYLFKNNILAIFVTKMLDHNMETISFHSLIVLMDI